MIGIEGIAIIGIAGFVFVMAFFGSTVIGAISGFVGSITAMATGVATGATTLLTAWLGWATAEYAFTNYVGLFWLIIWGVLFAFAGFKIATKDKPNWTNAWGKGSNYLGAILLLFLVLQPILISAGVTYLSDTTAYSEVDYNVQIVTDGDGSLGNDFATKLYNATTGYTTYVNPITYDNTTKEQIVASLDFETVTSPTSGDVYTYMNATPFADSLITKIELSWYYVGTGNITSLLLKSVAGISKTFYTSPTTMTIATNGTIDYIPESYESYQLQTSTILSLWFNFDDSANLPTDGGYMSMSVKFYTTATVMNQATMMFWLAIAIGLFDTLTFLYLSNIYKYFT